MTERISGIDRRHVLGGVAAASLGLPLLAACGSGSDTSGSAGDDTASTPSPAETSGTSGTSAPASKAPAGIVATSKVPVGGGVVIADDKVVVVQPKTGEFLGWSAICTHQGCTVSSVSGGLIHCPCHGSAYSIEDGSVQGGPAPKPLPKVAVKVQGGQVDLA